jgi:hypothetical protein
MNRPNSVQSDLYEKVLEHARREIDEASGKIEELRGSLQLLEARVEAAKSVYEAVAARLNLEDELEGESEAPVYAAAPPPEQAPEPPEEPEAQPLPAPEPPEESEPAPEAASEGSGNGGFSMDLIRRHFEQKGRAASDAPTDIASGDEAPESGSSGNSAFPELSEAERKLIEEHMRSRAEAERKG